jgi:hypothetical protein
MGHEKICTTPTALSSYQNYFINKNQSGAAEAWWAHNPQIPGSKPCYDTLYIFIYCFLFRFLFSDVFLLRFLFDGKYHTILEISHITLKSSVLGNNLFLHCLLIFWFLFFSIFTGEGCKRLLSSNLSRGPPDRCSL